MKGELPADLLGSYYRNGTNPVFEPNGRYHPFDGDGMVHAVHLSENGAHYINRLVDTPALIDEREAGASVSPGVMGPFDYSVSEFGIKDTSNTDLFALNGELVSLWYNAGNPVALDPQTLATKGGFRLDGRGDTKMSAHSKVDWATGELLYFDYNDTPPYMTYGVANARGEVIHEVPIDLPGVSPTAWISVFHATSHDSPRLTVFSRPECAAKAQDAGADVSSRYPDSVWRDSPFW